MSDPPNGTLRSALTGWFGFGVGLALLPIIFNGLGVLTGGSSLTLGNLLGHGELLIITVVVAASAASRLLGEGVKWMATRKALLASCIVLVAVGSWWFAEIAGRIRDKAVVSQDFVGVGSLLLFALTVITGTYCVIVEETR